MTNLMVLAGVLVSIAVAVAVITAQQLDMIRRDLARLAQLKAVTYGRLAEVIEHKKAAEGSRMMLGKLRQSKKEQIDQFLIDVAEME